MQSLIKNEMTNVPYVSGVINIDISMEYVGLCLVCRRTETYACQVGSRHMTAFYLPASNDSNKPPTILGLIKT